MKFLIDAHLPKGLSTLILGQGHDAIHTSELPLGNATSDRDLINFALAEDRVIITKDRDFYYSHVLQGVPRKLILIRVGNMGGKELLKLMDANFPRIIEALKANSLVEIDR